MKAMTLTLYSRFSFPCLHTLQVQNKGLVFEEQILLVLEKMTLNIYESKEKITSIPDLKTHGKIFGVLGIINIHGFSFLCCITG